MNEHAMSTGDDILPVAFKKADAEKESKTLEAVDSILAEFNARPSILMRDGLIVHRSNYAECWKLREIIRKCGGQVDMFTNTDAS